MFRKRDFIRFVGGVSWFVRFGVDSLFGFGLREYVVFSVSVSLVELSV